MKDRHHIEMEDISMFPFERSADYNIWEEIAYEEIDQVLKDLADDKIKCFLGVVRSGSHFKLDNYYYRIKA